MRIILILAMLYGLWDLYPAYAQPAAARLKTVAAYWYIGSRPVSGVDCMAYLVPPSDSIQFMVNTFNGSVYAPGAVIDSSQSGSDGKQAVRVPLSSDISPTGTRVRLVYTYRGQTWFDTQNLPTPNLSLTDTAWTCIQKATGQATTCP